MDLDEDQRFAGVCDGAALRILEIRVTVPGQGDRVASTLENPHRLVGNVEIEIGFAHFIPVGINGPRVTPLMSGVEHDLRRAITAICKEALFTSARSTRLLALG